MLGKWYMARDDLPRRVYPDYCPGWLYVTTPKIGLALAEVAAQYADEVLPMAKMDDVFVTGILRERLGMSLTQMAPGLWSRVWDTSLSECPFISMIKLVFFNDIVLEKGNMVKSSRQVLHYRKGQMPLQNFQFLYLRQEL